MSSASSSDSEAPLCLALWRVNSFVATVPETPSVDVVEGTRGGGSGGGVGGPGVGATGVVATVVRRVPLGLFICLAKLMTGAGTVPAAETCECEVCFGL